jgi:transitional endoplasmic reticulum ATPase
MQEETLVLRVAEARPQDVGRRIARIARQNMLKLNLRPGDFISITGQRTTVARVWPLPDEEDSDIIRIDGIIRHNAGTTIGDAVKIKAIELNSATKLILAPIEKISFGPDFTDYVKSLLKDMPVTKGDTILIPILGEALKLVVSSVQPSPSAYVTHDTEIIIKEEPVKEIEAAVSKVTYEDIGDLEDAKIKIREMIELPMKHPELFKHLGIEPPKGILLYGPPGCGKTLLAKAVATESGANFFSINGPEIMSKFYGESESRLREIFEEAEKAAPSVIFIDEIDSIAPKREEVTGEVERRVVAQLLTLMDGLKSRGQVVVIAATNRPEAVDPALRRPGRFDREIAIPMPDKKARKEILQVHLRNMPLADDVNIDELAELTHGYSGADIAALAREAAIRALRRFLPKIDLEKKTIPANILKDLKVSRNDFFEAMKDITPSTLREVYVEVPEIHWNDIGGLEDVKKQLREMVELPMKNPELFEKMGITPPKGILLYGPPGCGKTLLAKAVATESGANFFSINGPEIMSKFYGESESRLREIFEEAEKAAPSVIFIDEIDSIAPVRGGRFDSGVTERIVNQLLAEMDGLIPLRGVVVIAATNRPDIVDPALLRPGRFDRLVFIPLPDKKAREEIFKVHIRKMPLAEDVNISVLADMTEGYTGADIEAICREAALNAIREDLKPKKVEMKHFIEAIKNTPKSLSPEDVKRYETMKNMLRFYQ